MVCHGRRAAATCKSERHFRLHGGCSVLKGFMLFGRWRQLVNEGELMFGSAARMQQGGWRRRCVRASPQAAGADA